MEHGRRLSLQDLSTEILCKICLDIARPDDPDIYEFNKPKKNNLDALSCTNKFFLELCAPYQFRSVSAKREQTDAVRFVEVMKQCRRMQQHTRYSIYYVDDTTKSEQSGMAMSLTLLLSSMTQLRELTFAPPLTKTQEFRTAFLSLKPAFPLVDSLVLSVPSAFVLHYCPNVTKLSTHGLQRWSPVELAFDSLVHAAGRSTNIKKLELDALWRDDGVKGLWILWHVERVAVKYVVILLTHCHYNLAVVQCIPKIQSLALFGRIQGKYHWDSEDADTVQFKICMQHLSTLRHLRELALPDASQLGLGFQPPRCGNVYHGRNGAEIYERVQKEQADTEEMAAGIVAQECPQVTDLWFDNTIHARISRSDLAGGKSSSSVGRTEITWNKEALRAAVYATDYR